MDQNAFFNQKLETGDPDVFEAIRAEHERQQNQIELIASENIASRAVMAAQGSVMTNKYAEGYPGKRYYQGCAHVDVTENLAIERACKLYNCKYANVQPHSGAQANQGVFLSLLKPGDTFLGMSLEAGGHLTHGARPNLSGKWFTAVQYGVRDDDGTIDYDEVAQKAQEHQPKLIIAGASAYPRAIDWARFREIADEVGAWFMVDMAHYSGLVAGGAYPSPFPHAHVVTTTTHKTLRGPRGGMILTNEESLGKSFNASMFPGLQGGPLEHVIAAKAVAFGEALKPDFSDYAKKVVDNAKILSQTLIDGGLDIVTGGTDSHIVLVDMQPKGVTGKDADLALEHAGITCNKNAVPNDPQPPAVASGIRLGTPAGTTRGFGDNEWREVGRLILKVLDGLKDNGPENNQAVEQEVREEVKQLCDRFPIYEDSIG
jgi:glycine hydroxymethyltransferase